ncbi:hypothetical protein QYE76_009549 [Lolium multiflorum]|uniref:Uncharacterized protein n=1 Tax=Lolium multiflorum TaxID=4521 RepID=A0AAD8X3G2_LOLMU|nr:hypothetical protein QYE76_009549 [Lolium multiflorum]
MTVQDKPSGLLGRIVELKRGGQDLGPSFLTLSGNAADISAATRGIGKDRLPAPDPPSLNRRTPTRLKRAVKSLTAWYDVTANVVVTVPEASIEALKEQVAKLQAEKEQLIRDHQEALSAQQDISRKLKDQAMQAGARRGKPPAHKAAAEEARKAQKAAEDEVARLKAEQKEYDLLVTRTDALALRLFPDSQAHAMKKVAERAKQAGANLPPNYSRLFGLAGVPDTFSLDRLKGAAEGSGNGSAPLHALEQLCPPRRRSGTRARLDALTGVREGAETDLDPILAAKRQDRAYRIASTPRCAPSFLPLTAFKIILMRKKMKPMRSLSMMPVLATLLRKLLLPDHLL